MKAWNNIPGVHYPRTPHKRPRQLRPEDRIDAAAIAALFGCSRAHARRLGEQLGGPARRAVDPASGKSVCYYRAAPIRAAAEARRRSAVLPRGKCPKGYCTTRDALDTLGCSYSKLRRASLRGLIRTLRGHSPRGKSCLYFCLADLRALS